jgi:hypothetical protein
VPDLWFNSPHGGRVADLGLPLDRPLLYRGRKWVPRGPVRLYDSDNQQLVQELIEYRDLGPVEGANVSETPIVILSEELDPPPTGAPWVDQ